jgi:ribosomal protein L7/L12
MSAIQKIVERIAKLEENKKYQENIMKNRDATDCSFKEAKDHVESYYRNNSPQQNETTLGDILDKAKKNQQMEHMFDS